MKQLPARFYARISELRRGFTVVEMLVVLAVITIISTVVLVGYGTFRANVLLSNLVYDVALSIRQAQTYGLSVRAAGAADLDTGYGIHFDRDILNAYVLFADRNRNRTYDGASEIVEVFTLEGGYSIRQFCGELTNGGQVCSRGGGIRTLNILFIRPEPDAVFTTDPAQPPFSSATITIQSSEGTERSVIVSVTGQIEVSPTVVGAPSSGSSSTSGSTSSFGSGSGSTSSTSGGPTGTWQGPTSESCTQGAPEPQITPGASCSPLDARGYESFNKTAQCPGSGQFRTFTYECRQ